MCVSAVENFTPKNMSTCGYIKYNGDSSVCRKLPNCEVPLDTKAKNVSCTCKSGFSMRTDGTCGLSCLKTIYDPNNPSVCTNIINCMPP